jgi:hypothetical protein
MVTATTRQALFSLNLNFQRHLQSCLTPDYYFFIHALCTIGTSVNKTPMANTTPNSALQPVFIQHLLVNAPHEPGGQAHPSHLSAASGVVRRGRRFVVVADDAVHLGLFEEAADSANPENPENQAAPGTLMPLLGSNLETLALLPPLPGCPAGALLALGSGITRKHDSGVLAVLDVQGAPNGRMASVNLAPLYAPLRKKMDDLNIEGALVVSDELILLQRGSRGQSTCIRYDWNKMAPWLAGLQPLPPTAKSVQKLPLGNVSGVPLSVTDATALEGGAWMFCAVAQRMEANGQYGPCIGSSIGLVSADGELGTVYQLQGAPKVEGIAAQADGADWLVTLVTDPADPTLPAQVLRVRVPRN